MRIDSVIARALYVVDRALRSEFPDDYDKRCLYAAFGTCALIQDAGFEANIAGGEFLAFVVSKSGQRAGLQGFGANPAQPSHYWVEVEGTIVDLGPHYLPRGSSFPAEPMPIVAWRPGSELPRYLRYRTTIRYAPDAELQSDGVITVRKEAFVSKCQSRYKAQVGQPKLPVWLLSGSVSFDAAVLRRDTWARNAKTFANGIEESQLPF